MDDTQLFSSFFTPNDAPQQTGITLSELLEDQLKKLRRQELKLQQSKQAAASKPKAEQSQTDKMITPQVIQIYRDIGNSLSSYKSGKLPKAFTFIPQLENWEQLLRFTEPDV